MLRQVNKAVLVALIGLLLACIGGGLRVHFKAPAPNTFNLSALIGSTNNLTLSASNPDDTASSAAWTEISRVMLYSGGALFVLGLAAWLFGSPRMKGA